MPAKSDLIRLRHMLGAAEKALHFTRGKTRADLDRDEQLSLALVRILEIMGEAAAKVTVVAKRGTRQFRGRISSERATG